VTDGPTPGSARWWQERRAREQRRRRRADGHDTGSILTAAIALLDAEGADALTMRRLADRLGLTHTSLYRHVARRDELLVLVVDEVLGEVRPAPQRLVGREAVEWHVREFRRVLHRHPAVVPLLAEHQLLGPNAIAGRERGLTSLLELGADPELAARAYLVLSHFVIGSAVLDSGGAARTADERDAMAELFAQLPPSEYPTVRRLAETLNEPDPDDELTFGLEVLLDGIEARIGRAKTRRGA